MNIRSALTYGKKKLKDIEDIDPLNESRYILSFLLDKDISYIHAHIDEELTKDIYQRFIDMIDKRNLSIPLQYLTKRAYFYGREFYVDERVLIPRFDTEILVDAIIDLVDRSDPIEILEIGSGSGALGLSLAKELEKSFVTSVDISEEAIEVARINKKKLGIDNIEFIRSNIFSGLDSKYDIIVSNPPYINKEDMENLDEQVKKEPYLALYGGDDGLNFYKKITKDAHKYLNRNGFLCFEIGYDQYNKVYEILKGNNFKNISFRKDLQAYKRVIYGSLK